MLDLSKAVVTVDASPETLAKFDRAVRYSQACGAQRIRMACEEQKEWDRKYLNDILMPGEKATLRFIIRSWWIYRVRPFVYRIMSG